MIFSKMIPGFHTARHHAIFGAQGKKIKAIYLDQADTDSNDSHDEQMIREVSVQFREAPNRLKNVGSVNKFRKVEQKMFLQLQILSGE